MYVHSHVTFNSHGDALAGRLFTPKQQTALAGVVIIGPVSSVKEQSPLQYATRLAQNGITALIFDTRYRGDSTGEPRFLESGTANVEDLIAALDFLDQSIDAPSSHLGLLGVCQGVNWAIEASVQDKRVKFLALVAGHYLTPQTALMYLGDEKSINSRKQRSDNARLLFEKTNEVKYIPVTGSDEALLTHQPPNDWYSPWALHHPWFAHRGNWENKMATMSEAGIWGWRTDLTLPKLKTSMLMVHSEHAACGREIPQMLFELTGSDEKNIVWLQAAGQLQFYEDPVIIDEAIEYLIQHFSR